MLLQHKGGAVSVVDCSYATPILPEPFPETLIEIDGDAARCASSGLPAASSARAAARPKSASSTRPSCPGPSGPGTSSRRACCGSRSTGSTACAAASSPRPRVPTTSRPSRWSRPPTGSAASGETVHLRDRCHGPPPRHPGRVRAASRQGAEFRRLVLENAAPPCATSRAAGSSTCSRPRPGRATGSCSTRSTTMPRPSTRTSPRRISPCSTATGTARREQDRSPPQLRLTALIRRTKNGS